MTRLVYAPYAETIDVPNVVVDGSANRSTVLTLSHWPGTLCPDELRADLSAEMAFRYVERGEHLHGDARVVTNNHFDEDGVVSVFALIDPSAALEHRDFLVDVARTGDFGWFVERDAARASMLISAFAAQQGSGDAYRPVLPLMPRLRESLDEHRELWIGEDERLSATERAITTGSVTISEQPEIDLAVVTAPDDVALHEMAVHNATPRLRVLTRAGRHLSLRYRYESWVLLRSRRPPPRIDLQGLAERLTDLEPGGVSWSADPVDDLTPQLAPDGDDGSDLEPAVFEAEVRDWLLAANQTWSPYASEP